MTLQAYAVALTTTRGRGAALRNASAPRPLPERPSTKLYCIITDSPFGLMGNGGHVNGDSGLI